MLIGRDSNPNLVGPVDRHIQSSEIRFIRPTICLARPTHFPLDCVGMLDLLLMIMASASCEATYNTNNDKINGTQGVIKVPLAKEY